ncbi:tRNA:m(4)X modification enzyme TRM13 homolog isoform X2 [Rhinatrema bivittatum]|uniref:tRNA:m(4)X modification enzyme TRM13 homolog isoform X2 n=1 Tax=Rhinatrema bivittatum TaxID=194408 RepID=UPI001126AF48|nr:tRNA:m(4)X modification enzyme TRM13 homolog isoform X2 [Rhinatrema bivittatum]
MAMEAAGLSAPYPGRCTFFVQRKKRFCKMVVGEGKSLCGEHANTAPGNDDENNRKRIPCPLDPKHTVYEDQLEKHLKKCNSREKPKPVYYVQDINAGFKDAMETEDKVSLSSLSEEELMNLIRKLRKASSGLAETLEDRTLSHQALHESLHDPKNGESAFKHLKQQASILGNMDKLGLLKPRRCFVEFGAGRGKLSHWIAKALQDPANTHFLLVERATTRFKVDGKHANRDSVFERLQIDIQHLCLNRIPILVKQKLPVVGTGKHLCGAATDLALRCLVESYGSQEEEPTPKRLKTENSEITDNTGKNTPEGWLPVAGIVIALCCHHKCDWKHYVGKEFFHTLGLQATDFSLYRRMSSWATCGMRQTETDAPAPSARSSESSSKAEDHHTNYESTECLSDELHGKLPVEERETIGRLCKLLIDHGRLWYLRQKGYDAALQYYTSALVSLENILLTAVPAQL